MPKIKKRACTIPYFIVLIQSFEEEVLVWVFPNHKCQKSLSKSRGEAELLGETFLA